MKKYSLIILIGLLFFCFGFSPHMRVIARKKSVSCNTIISQTTQDAAITIGSDAANIWGAVPFYPGGIATIKTFYIMLAVNRTGDMAGEVITASICTQSGGNPTETCTNADATLDCTTLTTTPTEYKFNIAAGYVVADVTNYGLRIHQSKYDPGDYIYYYYNSTGTRKASYNDDPATSWTDVDTSAEAYIVAKDCVE